MADSARRLAFWVPLALCTWLALTPGPPQAVAQISDVVLHLAAFAYLAFALSLAHFSGRGWATAAWLVAFGVLLEVLQGALTTTRSPELKDLAMDLAGIGLGLVTFKLLGNWAHALTERMFGRQ